jgi:FAD/FMN-containing dehydrogenase
MATSPADVTLAIAYAREHSLVLSVRSGGHSNAGLGTNDGGMIIDVSHMNDVTILDKSTGRVRIGAGAKWGDVAKTLDAAGLGISSGDTSTVGVSGLTLGAGVGWMVRKYGLALDSLQSVELVTAEGEVITASEASHPDLFWAVRGGGGNFGVATAFEFIAHPVGQVYFGQIMFAPTDVAAWLRGWRDVMRTAPEELTTMAVVLPEHSMGSNPAMHMVLCCWDGDDEAAVNSALAPIRALAPVVNDAIAKKSYHEVLEEAHTPPGDMRIEVNNAFFDDFSDEVVQKITDAYKKGSLFQIRSLGGAMNRVAPDATAFAHRASEVLVVAPQFFPANATEEVIQQGLQPWRDIATTSNGAYINFFSQATEREVNSAYPEATYKKLAAVKKTYDPHNVFNQNINIKPA